MNSTHASHAAQLVHCLKGWRVFAGTTVDMASIHKAPAANTQEILENPPHFALCSNDSKCSIVFPLAGAETSKYLQVDIAESPVVNKISILPVNRHRSDVIYSGLNRQQRLFVFAALVFGSSADSKRYQMVLENAQNFWKSFGANLVICTLVINLVF